MIQSKDLFMTESYKILLNFNTQIFISHSFLFDDVSLKDIM